MMESLGFLRRLLEKNFPIKNVVCLLSALLLTVAFYSQSNSIQLFQEAKSYGNIGVGIALVVVFLIALLGTWLVYSWVAALSKRANSHRREVITSYEQDNAIQTTLLNLSPWQRQFVLRFVLEHRTQIPDFEVGGYRMAWDSEMAVLIHKRIIKEIPGSGVYEITPIYYNYLIQNWNPQTGKLT